MSGLLPQYKIDTTTIDKYAIQSMISQSQNIMKTTTIAQLFHLCDKLIDYDHENQDKSIKMEIKSMVEQKLTNKQIEKQWQSTINTYKINMEKMYPLNKPGNFGRVLQRKSRLVPKGVMQYEQGKQAKLKQVKSFINRVEHVQNKELADLAWISTQPQKFKFRIILLDTNQNKKGIYFQTLEQAEYVRAYLVYRFKKTSVDNQVFGALKYNLLQGYAQGFVNQIKHRHQIKKRREKQARQRLQNQESNKLTEINFNLNQSMKNTSNIDKSNIQINSSGLQQSGRDNPQEAQMGSTIKIGDQTKKGFMTGFLDDLINRHNDSTENHQNNKSPFSKPQSLPHRTINKLQNLNQIYRTNFFNQWRNAVLIDQPNQLSQNSILKFNPNDQPDIPSGNHSNLRKNTTQTKKQTNFRNHQTQRQKNKNATALNEDRYRRVLSPYQNNPFYNDLSPNNNQRDLSPSMNSRRTQKVLGHSRKQQSIFAYPQKIPQDQIQELQANKSKKGGTQKIIFKSIQFLEPFNTHNTTTNNNNNSNNNNTNNNTNAKSKAQQQQTMNENINSINQSQVKGATTPTKNVLLIKPIVAITVCKRNTKQQDKYRNNRKQLQKSFRSKTHQKKAELVFNTILKKLFRTSQYQLTPTEGQGVYQTSEDLNNIDLVVSVSNFLTNEQLCQTQIHFKDYCFNSYNNTIVDKNSTIKLKFQYKNTGVASPQVLYHNTQHSESSLFFSYPKIDPEIIHKIKTYWQSEAVSNSYYNLEDNFNLFDAVTNSSNEAQPSNWWLNLDQIQYNYLCILQSSSFIVGYKLLKPMLYIIRAVKHIHFKIQKIIEMLLSIIVNLGSCYYFPKQLDQINYLHRQVGLSKGTIPFQNRVLLQVLLFDRFLTFQCPLLDQKLQSKNISISHLMLEYTYELFSRNFPIEVLSQLWNYCCEEIPKIPLIFFLTTIALCKLLSEKLTKCNRLSEVKEVFQSKQIKVASLLLLQIKYLRTKYFFKGEGFIEQIKQAFEEKPFEQVLRTYYRKLSEKQELEKKQKTKYKRDLSLKLQQVVNAQQALQILTKKVPQRKYILHIYFYQLPEFDGKMLIISGKNQYESLGQQKNRYFIIGELTSQVHLKYTDWKGNSFTGELTFIQGFNEFKIKIYSDRKQQSANIHYLAGLLTQTQIDIIKTNKKFTHFMGPNITLELFKDELLKPTRDLKHISGQDFTSQPWFKDLKNMFSYGNKLFNQISYFMNILQVEPISPEQKIMKLRDYSLTLSKEFFLSQNQIIFKHLLFQFYKMSFNSLKEQDFNCYFNDALQNQFQAPKIMKCRFYCENRQFKLEKQLIQYHAKKSTNFLYGDLFIDQIVSFCQKNIRGKITSNASQGELKVLFSTFGQIQMKVIPIKIESKSFVIDRQQYIDNQSIFHQLSQKQPEILMTQILPSFAKISTILDYVNTNRTIDLRQKTNQTERKVIPESINLLKFAQHKFRNCLLLRYNKYPQYVEVPFFSYFCELTTEIQKPKFKYYYMNNVKDSIKSVCITKQHLKCSANNKEQDKDFDKKIGLYGNLRRVIREAGTKINTVFFWTDHKDDNLSHNSLVCVNYGYGISRWQYCTIRKYRKKVKERVNKKGSQGENKGKPKIEYLVERGIESYFARDYEVKMSPGVKEQLTIHKEEGDRKFEEVDNDIKKGFSFLINPNNLRDFVKSIKAKS